MSVNNNMGLMNDNIIYVQETNWSIVSEQTDIWTGSLPFNTGDIFPNEDVKNRASISATNKLIYDNQPEEIYTNILSIFPEIDPMYGWQIREIITQLPYFKNATNAWVGLIAGDIPLIDTSEELDMELSEVLDNSNLAETLQNEVRSRFLDIISAYRVEMDIENKPYITAIDSKNLICFVNKDMPSSIEVNVVFSIYENDEGKFIDFVEYHYNGYIKKSTFEYGDNVIGMLVNEEEDRAFGGKFDKSPIIVFRHNVTNNGVYGTDQFRYWYPSMLGAMRELQNVLRLGERTREMIRKVPDSSIRKSEVDGSSVFFNKGTISYPDGKEKTPDIEYVVPEIRMEEAIRSLESAVKQVGMDTQLGVAFYDMSILGSRISADGIRAAMFPARLEAQRVTTEMKRPVKELVVKLGYLLGLDINQSKLSVDFYDGFPKDELEDIKAVQMRLESDTPSITLVDAIMRLDRVPLRVAQQKAVDIYNERADLEELYYRLKADDSEVEVNNGENEEIDVSSELRPTAGKYKVGESHDFKDDTVWDNQMIIKPRDIPQGRYKGVRSYWMRKRLRENL